MKRALQACIDELTLVWKAIWTSLLVRDVFLFVLAAIEQVIEVGQAETIRLTAAHELLLREMVGTHVAPEIVKVPDGSFDVRLAPCLDQTGEGLRQIEELNPRALVTVHDASERLKGVVHVDLGGWALDVHRREHWCA